MAVLKSSENIGARVKGFTLLEIMIALALGLLLSVGILSLFQTTSHTNKLQNGLARLQENGRFAVSRIESDLRMLGGQACGNFSGNAITGADKTPVWAVRAIKSYAPSVVFPDAEAPATHADAYNIDPELFVKGYECSGGCTIPALGSYSDEALVADSRVPNSDVLTIRYQTGTGWPVKPGRCMRGGVSLPDAGAASIQAGDVIELVSQAGNDEFPTVPPSAVLLSSCAGSVVLPVSAMGAGTITVGDILADAPPELCLGSGTSDVRAFDMASFVSVTYFLAYRTNEDPDAGGRLVPTLVRRENGGAAQDLVQGVDQLEFTYGVLDVAGTTRYLTASEIDSADVSICTPPADGLENLPGCLWRSVRSVEARLLVNSTNELHGMDDLSRSYVFNGTETSVAADGSTALPSGQPAGSMLRREFIAQTMIRNRNP